MTDSSSLAGREKEFAQLNSFLWPAIAGQGKVVFVTGRAETDTRTFVESSLSQVQNMHPTVTVALGECREGGEPFLPFKEIMRLLTGEVYGELEDNAVSGANADRLRALLENSGEALLELGPDLLDVFVEGSGVMTNAALYLAGNVPWLQKLAQHQATAPKVDKERLDEGRLFEEYTNVLSAVAQQHPLVLGLLDLQWADEGSIGLLFHLSRHIKDVPMLIIGTYRPDEVAASRDGARHPLESTLNEIKRYYGSVTIPLDAPADTTSAPTPAKPRLADRVPTTPKSKPEEPPVVRKQPEAVPFVAERPVFVGRSRELAQLQSFLDAALDGQGQVVFVTGEPGAGKSTLIEEFAYRAQSQHADLVVAVGDCNAQTGAADAYLPFREILSMLTGDVEGKLADQAISQENADRLQGLLRWSGQALVELGPDLIDIFVPGGGLLVKGTSVLAERAGWTDKLSGIMRRKKEEPDPSASGLEQSNLFEQYTNVICKLAERNPLVLVLDDLQWADEASIALLFHLGRRIADQPVLVIGTYRPNDVAMGRRGERHPLEPVVAELKRYYAQIEINLGKTLDEQGRRQFVSDYVDAAFSPHQLDEDFIDLVFRRTQGHALFVVELLWDLRERGVLDLDADGVWHLAQPIRFEDLPARVDAVIGERIARLDQELRDILTCASVEGEDFTAQVVARVQQLNERELARHLSQELDKQHHLVDEGGVQRLNRTRLYLWRFNHGLFQDYLYQELSEMERMLLHEDVGRCLEDLYGDEAGSIAVQLARHFLEAEVFDKAFEYLKMAGDRARVQYANEEAIDYYRTALEVAEEIAADVAEELIPIHEHLGDVLVNVGEYDQALESYTTALDRLQGLGAPAGLSEQAAALHRKIGIVYRLKGKYATALEWLNRAQDALQDGTSREMALICTTVASVLYRQGEAEPALDWCQRGLEIARAVDDQGELAHAYMLRGTIHADLGDLDASIDDCLQSLDICQQMEDPLGEAMAHNGLGATYHDQGNWIQAIEHYERSLEIRKRIGDVNGTATVSNNLGEVYLNQGRLDEAQACFETCLESWERTGFPLGVALSHRNLGHILVKHQDWDVALEHLKTAHEILDEMEARDWLMAEVYRHLAEVYLSQGYCDTAWRYCERAMNIAIIQNLGLVEGNTRRVLGQVHHCMGELDNAEALLKKSIRFLEEQDLPYDTGQALMALALVYRDRAEAQDNEEDRVRMDEVLDRAIDIFEELGAEWDLAQARVLKAG